MNPIPSSRPLSTDSLRLLPTRRPSHPRAQLISILLAFGIFLVGWEIVVAVNNFPSFILPTPLQVIASWAENWQNGILPRHLGISLLEVGAGFSVALVFASVVGYGLAKSPLLEKIVSPYLIASQAVPLMVLGPLIMIWIGTGLWQNALVAALIAFFPMLINTMIGIRGIRAEYRELMRSYSANRWQVLTRLEIPGALPVFFGGVRVGMTMSVVGVTVVELLWADRGLGFLLNFSRGYVNTPLTFATVLTLTTMALSLYGAIAVTERLLLRSRRRI